MKKKKGRTRILNCQNYCLAILRYFTSSYFHVFLFTGFSSFASTSITLFNSILLYSKYNTQVQFSARDWSEIVFLWLYQISLKIKERLNSLLTLKYIYRPALSNLCQSCSRELETQIKPGEEECFSNSHSSE